MRPHPPHASRDPAIRAFSLIEVAMALGIVAFAFTALLGMLPVGLTLFRNATDTSVATRIVQEVSGDLQQADYDTLATAEGRVRYFDEHGTEQDSSAGAIYWAQVTIFPDVELPGRVDSSDLARIVIQVAHNPASTQPVADADGTSWKEENGLRVIKRSLFLARNTPQP